MPSGQRENALPPLEQGNGELQTRAKTCLLFLCVCHTENVLKGHPGGVDFSRGQKVLVELGPAPECCTREKQELRLCLRFCNICILLRFSKARLTFRTLMQRVDTEPGKSAWLVKESGSRLSSDHTVFSRELPLLSNRNASCPRNRRPARPTFFEKSDCAQIQFLRAAGFLPNLEMFCKVGHGPPLRHVEVVLPVPSVINHLVPKLLLRIFWILSFVKLLLVLGCRESSRLTGSAVDLVSICFERSSPIILALPVLRRPPVVECGILLFAPAVWVGPSAAGATGAWGTVTGGMGSAGGARGPRGAAAGSRPRGLSASTTGGCET